MIEFIYIPIILILYLRTWKYNVLIDDPVKRDGYMYIITYKKTDPRLYEVRRSLLATFTNIGVYISVCSYIHYLWGWKAAVLFSLFPLNVSGVAWTTGNYYMSTVLLVLSTYLLQINPSFITTSVALLMYVAALNSTLSSIPYIFVAFLLPHGWLFTWPLLAFLCGDRVRAGVSQRTYFHAKEGIESGKIRKANFLSCPKTMAYYIALSIFPIKLGFFHEIGRHPRFKSKTMLVLSCILCLLFWYWMGSYSWFLAFWWFIFIAIFSQFMIMGQFTAERYTYLANVAFCAVLPLMFTNDIMFTILCTSWFYRSWDYIPAWKHNKYLFSYSITQFPGAPENYNNLGSYYLDMKNPNEAINPLMAAQKLSVGTKSRATSNLASAFGMLGDQGQRGAYEHAMVWAVLALEEAPENYKPNVRKVIDHLNNRIIDEKRKTKKEKKRKKK